MTATDRVEGPMRPLALALLVLGLSATARADLVVPSPYRRTAPAARITSADLVSSDAPAADTSRLVQQARAALRRTNPRINQCVSGTNLRRDPLDRRTWTLDGHLVFARSTRPHVRTGPTRGLPPAVRSCISEALRGMAVQTRPRGTVELRFSYAIY